MRVTKTVGEYLFGSGTLSRLDTLLKGRGAAVYYVDHFFRDGDLESRLPVRPGDAVVFVDTSEEPTTLQVDSLALHARQAGFTTVVGIGGGSTLDVAKAVSNLLGNPGNAADYQGWDLLPNPGVFKIGIPTLSGTGAEATRTCVMNNKAKHLKLGMNSDYTVYDRLVLDPELTATVPRDQYFFTGMDTYIHCLESLAGRHRHPVADAYSREAMTLCREIYQGDDMMSPHNRERLMVASYLGGCAIGNSFVGVVHPLSAGLSMVLGTRHCVGNCIVMAVMDRFYPRETEEFLRMVDAQGVTLPKGLCAGLSDEQYRQLHAASVVHEKPLANALGDDFRAILTEDVVVELFKRM